MIQNDIPAGKPGHSLGEGERALSAVAGSLLLYFVAKRHRIDSLLVAGGGYLLYRAVSGHCPLSSLFRGAANGGHASNINVRSQVVVNKRRPEVYAFWRNMENLPLFMKHIDHIDVIDPMTSAWRMHLPAGMGDIRWESRIVKDIKDEEISWHSAEGATIENTAKINFSDTPGGATRIDVMVSYRAPMGVIGERIGRLLTPVFRDKIAADIHHFKHYIENAGVAGD
jgi:uncharacterized membrane protein